MMQPTQQNATVNPATFQIPLLRALSAATGEVWFLISLSDSLIRSCSYRFLNIWSLPNSLAAKGVDALLDDSMSSVRATAFYGEKMPAFGEFIRQIRSVVLRCDTGAFADIFHIKSHAVLDDSGLPLGKLVFLHPHQNPEIPSQIQVLAGLGKLSPRERDVVELLYKGATNRGIGLRLHVSEKTVEKHRASAMKKLAATSFADLIRMLAVTDFCRNKTN